MKIKFMFGGCLLILTGCVAPSSGALKPVAAHNQQNLAALARNIHLLLSTHEILLKAASNTLLYQQLAKTEAELIAVVGTPQLPLKSTSWKEAITQSSTTFIGKKAKFLERFQNLKAQLATNLPPEKRQQLSIKEGWIFSVLTNKDFTPQHAHETLKALSDLRRSNDTGKEGVFYEEAMRRLKSFDPRLEYFENTTKAAHTLLAALKQEVLNELDLAFLHSQAFVNYTKAEIDPQSTLQHFASNTLNEVISSLADRYIENPLLKKAAVSLLMKGSDTLTHNILGD